MWLALASMLLVIQGLVLAWVKCAPCLGYHCVLSYPVFLKLDACDICGVSILMFLQFSALDVLAGMMMKGAAKCDKHAE